LKPDSCADSGKGAASLFLVCSSNREPKRGLPGKKWCSGSQPLWFVQADMARFYKGVKLGSYLHGRNLSATGIAPAQPGASYSVNAIIRHIGGDPLNSPCVSLTKSYGVAQAYALDSGTAYPDVHNPAWVYEIELDKNDPAVNPYLVVDPVFEISRYHNDPLVDPSYHHNGDELFLLGLVDEKRFGHYTSRAAPRPRGNTHPSSHPPNVSEQLLTFVRALRDAEVLFVGNIPGRCIVAQHPAYYPLP
jgi:hypothetical protein